MRHRDDTPQFSDLPAAIGLLSRLPIRVDQTQAAARAATSVWAYPLAGLVIGLIACVVAQSALWLGLPAPLAAGLTLACLVITTGAMHEDGLADTADGLWGGWTKERRLEIMKDSHIGTYGVIALVLGLGLRWVALTTLLEAQMIWPAILCAAMLSRAMMVPLMSRLPHARDHGLSHSVGHPSLTTSRIAQASAIVATLVLLQFAGIWLIATAILAATACTLIAKAKLGGQTGDILGATQQITEITVLLTLVVVI